MSKPFKLSSVLFGHSLDVRSVVATPDNSIVSGSRDKTAKFWKSNMFNAGYSEVMTYKDQKNFVAAVLYLLPTSEFPDGLVITGGNDSAILIYKPGEPFAMFTIKEHTNTVCCLSNGLESGTFLSGSWDMSAKMWNLSNLKSAKVTFSGHTAAIWSAIQLSNNNIATASADRTIGIWMPSGQKIRSLTGHSDCVRGLLDLPDRFCSVSNDASIKVWSYEGENLETLYGHTNYIYSIARNVALGVNSFVTSDEDRTVRVWENSNNVCVLQLPAQSVWTVTCLSNGDIVTGSSDGVVRIFTQDEGRYASEEALKNFEEEVNALVKQSCQEIGGYKVSDLPGREALYDPGKNPGQMKMVREGAGVVAYTWVEDGDNSHWEKVGDVLGANDKANEGKTMFEGQAYDFVFSVDVEDGKPPLKLPYNKGEDVYVAANKFLERNNLPAIYLDQVVEFILKNSAEPNAVPAGGSTYVDPFTGGSRYTPNASTSGYGAAGTNVDPFTGGSSYSTTKSQEKRYFPHTSYIKFEMGVPDVILKKIVEFNQKVEDINKVEEGSIAAVVRLCSEPCTDKKAIDNLFKLLNWPQDIVFPVIDVVRLAARNEVNNRLISKQENGCIMSNLKQVIGKDVNLPNNTLVALRALCNLFVHPAGEELIFNDRMELLEATTSLSKSNKNIEIALATFLLNLTILALQRVDEVGLILLANIIPDLIVSVTDPEAQFRAYVALGTLISSGDQLQRKELRVKILQNEPFVSFMQDLSSLYSTDVELKRMKCAQQLQDELMK